MKAKLYHFSILLLILLLISNSFSQIKVFPDHYIESDSPYSSSDLYLSSDIKERQIYKLGYFSDPNAPNSDKTIKSYKFGVIYSPDKYCVDKSDNSAIKDDESISKFFYSITDKTSTRENNFSEELELLKHFCFGQKLIINTPFPTLHNTGYILKYKLSMTNDFTDGQDVDINISLRILPSTDYPICKFRMKGGKADWFKMTIKSKLASTNKITMMFSCEGESVSHNFDVNTNDSFQFIFDNGGGSNTFNVYISFYQVLLEDSSSSYVSSYGENKIIRTYNGMDQCSNDVAEKKCLIGFACVTKEGGVGNECKSCDSSCFDCNGVGSCSTCNALTDVGTDGTGVGTTCKKNYIDFSNFEDIKIKPVLSSDEFNERSTFGFWIFISDLSKARNGNSNIYHVVLKDRYVLSIIPNEISTGVYCHAYEDLYRTITTETIFESHYTDRESAYVLYKMIPTNEQLQYINSKDLSGQWFHVSCGLSFDHKLFHVTTMINGEEASNEKALRHENLYYDSDKNQYVENDIYNRHIIKDHLEVEFRNFGLAGSKVFLKYFILFQEYIPPSYKFMYYDLYDIRSPFSELILLQIKFDELTEDSSGYKINYKVKGGASLAYTLTPSSLKSIDLTPPKNFKLLYLLKQNTVYKNIDCNYDENNIAVFASDGTIYWDLNKPLFCPNYLNTKNGQCVSSLPCTFEGQKYISYPGISTNGFCDFICSGNMECSNDQRTFCKTNGQSDIYNLFYSCENKETKYYLQYSSFYSPETISIPISPALQSFIIELWYYPDFFLSDTNRQGKFYYPETRKNYIFYSDVATAYFLHSELKKLKVEDSGSTYTSEHYHPYEWNKLLFYGKFDGINLHKYFIINNLVNDYIKFKLTDVVTLNYIKFAISISDENEEYNWASGYYRGLRIWDGSIATPELTVLYDNYYSSGKGRIKSLRYYYPLTNEYIANNKIMEITDDTNEGISVSTSKLRKYNFSSKFDFIRAQYPSLQYFLEDDATAPKAHHCEEGCLRCWNSGSNCYECSPGYIITLERACVRLEQYYFKSPCVKDTCTDAVLKIDQTVHTVDISITVTFWVKTLGFNSDNPHPYVSYSDEDYLVYNEGQGLYLYHHDINQLIAYDEDFGDKIGKWAYISLSYSKELDHFPRMINFEINGNTLKIQNYPTSEMIFNKFKIPKNIYGFFCNIRYYHEYIVGAYGFATNTGNLISPFSIPQPVKSYLVPGSSASNCFDYGDFPDNNGYNFGCAGEKDRLFSTFAESFNNYIMIERGYGQPKQCAFKSSNNEAYCLNACKGPNNVNCTCLSKNCNSQMLINKDNSIYCKAFSYINFSKARKIRVKVRTAKETKKFTLQFWIYFINYIDGNFEQATINWDKHTNITVFRDGNDYKARCEFYTVVNKEVESILSEELYINKEKWNFISCSMNYAERLYYINTNNDIVASEAGTTTASTCDGTNGPCLKSALISNSDVPDFILNNDYTYLEISDNTTLNDWGYLFYRQIHLWKDAYFNAEFLSRVNILTPSKFPYLLHSWDTHFKGYKDDKFNDNFIIKDICGVADDIVVTKVDNLGFNYVSQNAADKDIELCSEDGQYYDMYTKNENHCLPFADLGLIDDFEFSDIPYSYTGTYSMAFWIFFEDSSTMSSGIHFQWERHLQITAIKLTQLQGYCLPQGYYSDDIPNSPFTEKLNNIPNYVSSNLVTSTQSESGVWIWVLCSVSNYAKKYFLKGNDINNVIEQDLIAEDLYFSDTTTEGQPVKNKYPYHYFMSEVENGVSKTSKLKIEGLANDKRIYIRDLFLFNDFIPVAYAEAFKNIDLSLIEEEHMLQSMVFVCNFANFNLGKMILTYHVINQENVNDSPKYTKTQKTVKLYRSNKIDSSKTFELCSNFGFIKIIDPIQGDLCKRTQTDTAQDTIFFYCNEDKNPIVCRELYYLSLSNGIPTCEKVCKENYIRVPGAPYNPGLCSIPLIDNIKKPKTELRKYNGVFECNGNYNQIGYSCFNKDLDEKSAFFFSRCYNQPNFYGVISNENKEKLQNGYFFEFWFKLDKVQILQHCDTTANEEYILFSTPHSIYLDLKENKYYYKIIDSIYTSALDGINNYEWNKIVIKTTLGVTLGQNVYVYINFDIDNIKATITNIPSSIKMELQYISFCSKEENGDCTPAGAADVTWGSAYYRNIRVWELLSSSIYSIQDFNIEIYTEEPLSLKLYYPLKISEMHYNVLNQTIGGNNLDAIKVSHEESLNFKSLDEWDFYNYADNFDWGVENDANKGKFISSMDGIYITSQDCSPYCERCYTNAVTNCYKCIESYVLKGMTCVYAQGKTFLKIPTYPATAIQFKVTDQYNNKMKDLPSVTITFYMKFEGANQGLSSEETTYRIMQFSSGTYLAYEPLTSSLELYVENTVGFRYTNYYNLIGQWAPYSVAVYRGKAPIPNRYPHMLTLSVNKEDIPFVNGFILPETLNMFDRITLGDKIIALFADLRIYKNFIQGSFGQSISFKKDEGIFRQFKLIGSTSTDCIDVNMVINDVTPKCVVDYTDYIGKSCGMDTTKYFDLSIPGQEPCAFCPDYCKTKCFNPNINQCTCDMTDGLYWLRRDKTTRQTYCEYIPSVDFSILKDVSFTVPTSQTMESTVEFWVFIYSYNSETTQFNSISVEWNLHNRVLIQTKDNTIYTNCFAFYDMDVDDIENKYTEQLSLSISGYSWLYIRCGTDFVSETPKYFLNNQQEDLITKDYPSRTSLATTFRIRTGEPNSFGYVFLRDIKLWQQYNFNYINTQYINLEDDVGLYSAANKKSSGLYPGLITFIKGNFDQDDYERTLNKKQYRLENLIGIDQIGYTYQKTYNFTRKDNFLGYNIIDPNNYNYYSDLVTCNEGYVYSSENNMCLEVSVTKCRYPGDISDNCISCPDESPYIYPPNGNCVNDCGVRFYKRDDIYQCRACHHTCYTCTGYAYNNCTSCTDNLYLVEDLHICVEKCDEYNLVASTIEPNKCVPFEMDIEIINYDKNIPIDINTFDFLVAEIKYISTKTYEIMWRFVPEKTIEKNPGESLNFGDDQVPYDPNEIYNLENLNVSLNHSFFQLRRNYTFTIDVISYNILDNNLRATRSKDFTFKTNSYPVDGGLEVTPTAGLHNTTNFLIRCQNWTDDTIEDPSELSYYFYAKEDLSDEEILLHDWSQINEITTKFILEKDSLPINNVTVFCKVRDNYMAESQVNLSIMVLTQYNDTIYSLEEDLKQYYLPGKQLSPSELLHISELVMSLGEDLYKVLRPTLYQSIYRPSVDKNLVVETKPECVTFDKECNYRGKCNNLVDEFLVCLCDEGYLGTNCHIDKNGGGKLLDTYKELYSKLIEVLQADLTYEEFKVIHNLFNGAKYFSEDPSFFSNQLETFLTMAMNVYPKSVDNNTYEYIDLLDFYFSYEYERLNKKRVEAIFNSGLNKRDLPLNQSDSEEFSTAFEYIHNQLISLIHYKCNMHINTQIEYEYSSNNFYIAVKSVNPTFDEVSFFEERKKDYKTYPKFMTCLNYIENNRLNNPYFQTFMIYIEYLKFPFGYDQSIYEINTSPLVEIRFLDATTGKNFDLSDCTGPNQININMPFTNYRWLDKLNEQKSLFDPRNYKSPEDPIFSDPIYINASGYVSDDTVEQRINQYHRRYNFSCRYYDIENMQFSDKGVVFTNFTSDTNFIQFNATHLSRFSTFFIPNNATFKVKGRFFYVPRTELLNWKGNYKGNFGFIVFLILIIAYAVLSMVLGCYDNIYFVKETLLESLKEEIVKSFLPYRSRKDREKEALKIIPVSLDPNLIDEKKFGDKTKENKRYDGNNEDTKNDDLISMNPKKDKELFTSNIGSGERLYEDKYKNNKSKEFMSRKSGKEENIMTAGNKTDVNLALETKDFYTSNVGRKETANININRLPDSFEDSSIEYNRSLYAYANLSLSFCEFLGKNIISRNILINPFLNINMFCPRWKKLILFTTNILSELLLLSVFLTNDEKALDTDMLSLVKYSVFTMLIADTFMHFMAIFFQFSGRQKRRLLRLVLGSGQLIVMKEYEDMQLANTIITVFGSLICYGLWIFTFYMSFAFYAVWKVQNKALIYSFFITVGLDFVVLDCFYELFLAIIYMQRKSSLIFRVIGEFLNRVRNYRCMN